MPAGPPRVLVLGAIASVQLGAAFADKLFDRAGPAGVTLLRLAFAAAILLALVRPRIRGRSRGDLTRAVVFGLVLGGMNWSFYEALHRLPLGVAVTVEFIGPMSVAVAGSRRAVDLLWVLLAASGVALLAGNAFNGDLSVVGLLLAVLAGACWAAYILASKAVGATFDGLSGLAIALSVGALFVLPAGLVEGGSALMNVPVLIGGLLVALLSSLIPYSFELTALRRLSATSFGLLMSLEPAAAAVAGAVVLSQRLSATTLAAVGLVVAASIGTTVQGHGAGGPALQ
ncbi:MAG TPA: EamA family transporter [Jatrophihabitantaceae bacterium]|jgi:inner membrane transporter RhtA|nr:EamA family transporter [Jatrophihabitantaceae bacterium]